MLSLSRRSIIVIAAIFTVVCVSIGYKVVQTKISGQIEIKGNFQEIKTDTAENNSSKETEKEKPGDKEITVHVIGRVQKPGLVKISENGRISDAIEAAGGALADADLELINLAYRLQDGKQVYIPSKSEVAAKPKEAADSQSAKKTVQSVKAPVPEKVLTPGVQPDKTPPAKVSVDSAGVVENEAEQNSVQTLININTADEKTLDALPQIGPSTAKKIIEYRNANGRFNKPEDIMKVKGIGQSKYDKIKDRITV